MVAWFLITEAFSLLHFLTQRCITWHPLPSLFCCPPPFHPSSSSSCISLLLSLSLAAYHRHPHQPSHQRPASLLCYHCHRHKTGRTHTNTFAFAGKYHPQRLPTHCLHHTHQHTNSRPHIYTNRLLSIYTFLSQRRDKLLNMSADVRNMVMNGLLC